MITLTLIAVLLEFFGISIWARTPLKAEKFKKLKKAIYKIKYNIYKTR